MIGHSSSQGTDSDGYDVIGDVHGHADRLKQLLQTMDYAEHNGAWRHPGGRTAVFVGDLIDRGPGQLDTVRLVRAMVEAGSAQIVMGNHEFNAIAYATVDPARFDFCRPHSEKNRNQHAAFLADVEFDSHVHREVIAWFREIPMWLDLGGLRVVHACWSDPHIGMLAAPDGSSPEITDELIVAGSTKGTDAYEAIEIILKGPEVPMGGIYYLDKDGHRRDKARMRWWDPDAETLDEVAHIPEGTQLYRHDDDPADGLPEGPFEAPVEPYVDSTPVLFGHYWWRKEDAEPARPTTTCLDFSVARGGVLRACRWDPGMTLDRAEYVDI